jgi:hypothetical protein
MYWWILLYEVKENFELKKNSLNLCSLRSS